MSLVAKIPLLINSYDLHGQTEKLITKTSNYLKSKFDNHVYCI